MKFRTILASLAVCASAMAAEVGVVEEIIAKVNGDIITRSEVDRSRQQLEAELKQRGVTPADLPAAMAEREKDLLREKIDQLLLIQKGRNSALTSIRK